MPSAGLQRIILDGVPYWTDSEKNLYAYDSEQPPLKIGSGGTLLSNWSELYEIRLQAYRASQKARPRLPAKAPSKK